MYVYNIFGHSGCIIPNFFLSILGHMIIFLLQNGWMFHLFIMLPINIWKKFRLWLTFQKYNTIFCCMNFLILYILLQFLATINIIKCTLRILCTFSYFQKWLLRMHYTNVLKGNWSHNVISYRLLVVLWLLQ